MYILVELLSNRHVCLALHETENLLCFVEHCCFCSVAKLCPIIATPWTATPSPRGSTNSCSLSRWCYLTISSSVIPFSPCPQSLPASGSFPMCGLFASGGQSTGVSASVSILSVNIQDWFPLGLTGWISLWYKGLSRVFSSTTVRKHQFFGVQPSLWSSSHILTWPLENHSFDSMDLCQQSDVSVFSYTI